MRLLDGSGIKYKEWTAPVPPMTHQLGAYWAQPDPNAWSFDATHVSMSQSDFDLLRVYSTTYPTGRYVGKMWRAQTIDGEWYLMWYHDPTSDLAPIQVRKILLVGAPT